MIYFYYGNDRVKAREKAHEVWEVMKKKRPGAEFFRVTSETWDQAVFEGYCSGMGLFEKKFIVFADNLFDKPEAKDFVLSSLQNIAQSENGFVFLEAKLDAPTVKKVEKCATKIEKFEQKDKGRKFSVDGGGSLSLGDFNIFSLGDAFGQRNKKILWTLFQNALDRGISSEEINGILFWQTKSIILAKKGTSPAETGLAPFVFSKSKRYAENFTQEELNKFSRNFISVYHDAHRGVRDFETALEMLILGI